MKTISRRYINSSSFKMALLFTVLLSVSAFILFYTLIDLSKRDFLRETEAAIDIEINILSTLKNSPSHILSYIQSRTKNDPMVLFRYENTQGHFIGGAINPLPQDIKSMTEGIISFDIGQEQETFAAKIHTFNDGSRIIIARNIHTLINSYQRFKYLSWLIVVLMLSVLIVSFVISYFVVSRIHRIALIAENIVDTGDLSQRIIIDSRWDDLSKLSQVLNTFLVKIESLMDSTREVSNNIAHDLRTPLSSLRNQMELLKGQTITDEKIDILLLDMDRILNIFQALLRIANIEKGKRSLAMQAIDLGKIIADVIELYEPVAEEKNICFKINMPPNIFILGDRDLLFQMFANIIDNAIKFSPPNSSVSIEIKIQEAIIVVIEDQGPGIADHEKAKVFRHFYRGDMSRNSSGNGLGLSLVRAVAEQHKAHMELQDAHPGLRILIFFQPYK